MSDIMCQNVKELMMGPFPLWQIKQELVTVILPGTWLCLPIGKSVYRVLPAPDRTVCRCPEALIFNLSEIK